VSVIDPNSLLLCPCLHAAGALTAVVQIVTQSAFGQEWLARDLNQVSTPRAEL
jgi:hypothetical protein